MERALLSVGGSITLFGFVLFVLKIIGFEVGLSTFWILNIIFWPVALVGWTMLLIMSAILFIVCIGGLVVLYEDVLKLGSEVK